MRISNLEESFAECLKVKDQTQRQISFNQAQKQALIFWSSFNCFFFFLTASLLEGASYPPEKRTSMAQSVGPLTALICYLRSEKKYENKYFDACVKNFKYIKQIDIILRTMKRSKMSENTTVLRLMANIALMVSARNNNRMLFPLLWLVDFMSSIKTTKTTVTITLQPIIQEEGPF